MPGTRTEVTELATALGTLDPDVGRLLRRTQPPAELLNVDEPTWNRVAEAWSDGRHLGEFLAAAANGAALTAASDGLRGRPPQRVEWRGPQRTPGDDTVPADLRLDHVYLVSCKYLSKVLVNAGPARLFERLLGDGARQRVHWFADAAPAEYQAFYEAVLDVTGLGRRRGPERPLPRSVWELEADDSHVLRDALGERSLPEPLREPWAALCARVSTTSANRWSDALATPQDRRTLLWRLLRIASVTYFVLGTQPARGRRSPGVLRLRVDSAWDWQQTFELRKFDVIPRPAGQPEVGWRAMVRRRADGEERIVEGHVEVRWSHGRFNGVPEAKAYLDTPHTEVPGYHPLT